MKKALKRSLSFLLAITIIFSSAYVGLSEIDFGRLFTVKAKAATSGTCGDNLTWTLDDEGVLTISGTGAMADYSRIYDDGHCSTVPWFSMRTKITKVIICNGVTSIGAVSFYDCSSLVSVTIPDSVTSIGYHAFSGCTSLVSVTIPDSVTSIGGGAFYDCTSLVSVTIPDSVTSIGGSAFYDCTSLTSITIPDSITSIGDWTFHNCTSLTSITIPDSVTSIGEYAFNNCTSLISVYISDLAAWCGIDFGYYDSNPLYYADNLYINGELATDVVIPDGVKRIADYGFSCKNITSVTIPNSVTSIGKYAFSNCGNLESVYITDVAAWCSIAFGYSSNPLCYAENLYINGELEKDVIIPDGVETIPAYALSCKNIVSVTIPDSVTSIGGGAFYDCTSLVSVTIPDSVTSIGSSAFSGCTSLTSITIPDSVTSIGEYALYACTSLTSITIPDSITSIGDWTFRNCRSLTSVTIPDSVTSIGDYAFSNCTCLASVAIGNGVISIGEYAFNNCTSLTSITIPDSVTSIGYEAFNNCTSLNSVTIGNGVTSIGDYAFRGCTSLISVYISDLAAWCGIDFGYCDSNPLYYADKLYVNEELATHIVIPDSVTSIGSYAFFNCTSLNSVTIGNDVTSIGNYAFYGCTSLASITIPDSVTSIGDSAFYHCQNLTYITIPDSVTSIGDEAFKYCTSLTAINVSADNTAYSSVDGVLFNSNKTTLIQYPGGKTDEVYKIADSVKSFVSSAFSGADFKTIVLGKGYTNVISGLFKNCSSLENVVIPANMTSISSDAFSGCENIKNGFYSGSQDEWTSMAIASGNTYLTNRRIHYNVDVEDWENHCTKPVVTKEPTCTSSGTQTYSCPCGYDVTEPIYAPGHQYPDEWQTLAPTCENRGYDYKECTACGYQYTTNWVYSLGHSWSSEWIVDRESTCTENGYKTRHCTVCDEGTDYMTIYADGHISSDKWTIEWEATCTNEGRKYKECITCHEPMAYECIPTVPHKSGGWIIDRNPTCTRTGLKHTECEWCGEIFSEERISALGHVESDWVIDRKPSCTRSGLKHTECTKCGAEINSTTIKANGHTAVTDKAVAATCTKSGKTAGSHCSVCNAVIKAQTTVAAKGHIYKTVTTKATLTKNGKVETKCSVCGNVSKTTVIYYPKTTKLSTTAVTYNGKVRTPSVIVKDSKGKTLVNGTDYKVTVPSGRKLPGIYTYTFTFMGKYSGTKTLTFKILPATVNAAKMTATQTTSSIKLTWGKVTGTTGYKVYQYSSSQGKYVQIATVTNNTYKKTGLKAGTTYNIKVKAYKKLSNGTIIDGALSNAYTTATKCAAPTISSLVASSGQKATIKWSAVTGATGYQIYYSTNNSDYKKAVSTTSKSASKTFSKSAKGKKIYFKVRAYKKVNGKAIYGNWSAVKSVIIK